MFKKKEADAMQLFIWKMVVQVVLYFEMYKKYLMVFVTYRLDMKQLADCFTVAGGVHIQASEPATSHRLHRHVVLLTY